MSPATAWPCAFSLCSSPTSSESVSLRFAAPGSPQIVPDDEIGLLPMIRAAAAIAVFIVDRDRGVEDVRFAGIKAISSLETVDQSSPERLLDGIAAPALVVVVFRAVAVDLRRPRAVDERELVAVHVVAGAEHDQPDDFPPSVLLERLRIQAPWRARCQSCAWRRSSRTRRQGSGQPRARGPDLGVQACDGHGAVVDDFHVRARPKRHRPIAIEQFVLGVKAEEERLQRAPGNVLDPDRVAAGAEERRRAACPPPARPGCPR